MKKVFFLFLVLNVVGSLVLADGGHGGGGPSGKNGPTKTAHACQKESTQGGEGNKSSTDKSTQGSSKERNGGTNGRLGGTGT